MSAFPGYFTSIARDGRYLVIERDGETERVDLSNVASVAERESTIVIRSKDAGETYLSLTSVAARAEALYQFAEWANPVIRKEIQQIATSGVTLAPRGGALRTEILGFLMELVVVSIFTILNFHYLIVLAASIFLLLRAHTHWKRFVNRDEFIQFHPAGPGGFARLSNGKQQFSLEHATFDVGWWGKGMAVVTDGTALINIPFQKRPGAFLLFATLLDICGSPDDRLVD